MDPPQSEAHLTIGFFEFLTVPLIGTAMALEPASMNDDCTNREAYIRERMEKLRVQYQISLDDISADENGLQKLAEQSTAQVSLARKKLLERRRARNFFKRSGNSLQKFISSLSQFLKAYPGLNDISKGADAQYGSLISGSLLLLVRVRPSVSLLIKNGTDECCR